MTYSLNCRGGNYMSAIGIFRRIDDLGRVVIPKVIRKRIGIEEGDSLEIFVNDEEIILRKYETSVGLKELVRRLYNEYTDIKCDMDTVTAKEILKHINALQEILRNE